MRPYNSIIDFAGLNAPLMGILIRKRMFLRGGRAMARPYIVEYQARGDIIIYVGRDGDLWVI